VKISIRSHCLCQTRRTCSVQYWSNFQITWLITWKIWRKTLFLYSRPSDNWHNTLLCSVLFSWSWGENQLHTAMLCSRVEYVVWARHSHLLFGKDPVRSRDIQPKHQVLAKCFAFFKVLSFFWLTWKMMQQCTFLINRDRKFSHDCQVTTKGFRRTLPPTPLWLLCFPAHGKRRKKWNRL